jgi:hypothetical protein
MRSNTEMLAILKGSTEEQKVLFDELIGRMASGELLDDGELIILETLKKELFKPKSVIVSMESNLQGMGGVSI